MGEHPMVTSTCAGMRALIIVTIVQKLSQNDSGLLWTNFEIWNYVMRGASLEEAIVTLWRKLCDEFRRSLNGIETRVRSQDRCLNLTGRASPSLCSCWLLMDFALLIDQIVRSCGWSSEESTCREFARLFVYLIVGSVNHHSVCFVQGLAAS